MFTMNLTNLYVMNNRPSAMHMSDTKHSLVDVHSYRVSVRYQSEHDYNRVI